MRGHWHIYLQPHMLLIFMAALASSKLFVWKDTMATSQSSNLSQAEILSTAVEGLNLSGVGTTGTPDITSICSEFPKLEVYPCANISAKDRCQAKGTLVCSRCSLVGYCSASCQKAHWSIHKTTCNSPLAKKYWQPSWETQRRFPEFAGLDGLAPFNSYGPRGYLWGNVPAIDLLKLSQKEYEALKLPGEETVKILIAASGDLRNVITTLHNINTASISRLKIVINDKNPFVVIRNLCILLLLFKLPGRIAAELIIHLWYSPLLTMAQDNLMRTTLQTYLDTVDFRKASKERVHHHVIKAERNVKLLASLTSSEWSILDRILKVKLERGKAIQKRKKIMLGRYDHFERFLCTLPSYERVSATAFRESGLLLPYAMSQSTDYCIPNPFLFDPDTTQWMISDSLSPQFGWDIRKVEEFGRQKGIPKHDLHGNLYFYIQEHIMGAKTHLGELNSCDLHLTCVDAEILPQTLEVAPKLSGRSEDKEWIATEFDRIEVSNICDEGYLGIRKVLTKFGPLLRRLNPEATLLTMFINAVQEEALTTGPSEIDLWRASRDVLKVTDISTITLPNGTKLYPGRLLEVASFISDYPAKFSRYMRRYEFSKYAELAGLNQRKEQRIITMWPYRLLLEPADQVDIKLHFLDRSILNGAECYVEWVRKSQGEDDSPQSSSEAIHERLLKSFASWKSITNEQLLQQGMDQAAIDAWRSVRDHPSYQDRLVSLLELLESVAVPSNDRPVTARWELTPQQSRFMWFCLIDVIDVEPAARGVLCVGVVAWFIQYRPDFVAERWRIL